MKNLAAYAIWLAFCSVAVAGDLKDQYAEYLKTAEKWQQIRNEATDCHDPSKMAFFLRESLKITDRVETSEENAKFTEEMALKHKDCMLSALRILSKDTARKVVHFYFEEPLYHERKDFIALREEMENRGR